MASDVIFGAFIPQGWKMELAGIDGAAAKWAKAVEIAVLAEELGYDSIWVYDHFHNVPRPAHEAVFECWTTMAAISQRTSPRAPRPDGRLQRLPGAERRWPRSPPTVDVISGGRLDWGIGAGWYENEFKGYGFEFPEPKVRIGMLREAVEIVKAMWTEPEVTYEGRYYQLHRAHNDPKPLQQPHPPIWIGGGGEQLTLRVVARHADVSNFGGNPEQWAHKAEVLKGHCADVGRDYDSIRKTWSPEVFVRSTRGRGRRPPARARSGARGSRAGPPATWWARPSRCARRSSATSTSAARASCPGAPTTPTPSRSSCSPARSSRASGSYT